MVRRPRRPPRPAAGRRRPRGMPARLRRARDLHAGDLRGAPRRAARRPDQRARRGRGAGADALGDRAPVARLPDPRRRPRDDDEPHRERRPRAPPPSRRAPPAAGRSVARRQRGRGVPALRQPGAGDRPGRGRGGGGRGRAHPARRRDPLPARRREPRPGALPGCRPPRPRPPRQPPPRLRPGRPLLPRGRARARRGPDRDRDPAARAAGPGRRPLGIAVAAVDGPARADVARAVVVRGPSAGRAVVDPRGKIVILAQRPSAWGLGSTGRTTPRSTARPRRRWMTTRDGRAVPADTGERYEAPKVETVLTSDDLDREGQYAGITPVP